MSLFYFLEKNISDMFLFYSMKKNISKTTQSEFLSILLDFLEGKQAKTTLAHCVLISAHCYDVAIEVFARFWDFPRSLRHNDEHDLFRRPKPGVSGPSLN